MTRADDYRQYAAELIRIAREAKNEVDKARLIRMAERWHALADKAEQEQKNGGGS